MANVEYFDALGCETIDYDVPRPGHDEEAVGWAELGTPYSDEGMSRQLAAMGLDTFEEFARPVRAVPHNIVVNLEEVGQGLRR